MMNSHVQYRTEQELLNCGFSEESLNSIKDATVIVRDGAQHIVPSSQSHLNEHKQNESAIGDEARLARQLNEQQRMFARFKQFTDGRIMTLERSLVAAQEVIKDIQNKLLTLQSNKLVRASYSAPVKQDRTPITEPIDRNKVSPAQVQVDKIFYCGER